MATHQKIPVQIRSEKKFDTDKKAIAIYLPEIAIAHIFDATNLTQYFCTGNP